MKIDVEAARAFFQASPFMADLGVEPVAVGEGRITSVLPLARRHLQHTGQVHAGVLAALADQTMGAAAQTLAPEGRWALTAEMKVSVLRPGRGTRLVCEAQVLRAGRNLSFTEAEVYTEADDGRRTLVMKSSGTMALVAVQPDA